MKKSIIFVLMSCLVLLSSCHFDKNFTISVGDGELIDPSANIVKKEFKQPPFYKMEVNAVANVKFIQSQGSDYRVVLSAPENYIDLFQFEVGDDELDIEFTKKVNIHPENVDITVYAPTLKKLDNRSVASVEADNLKVDKLEIENSGVGKVYINNITARKVEVDCSGVGSIEISGKTEKAELDCSGVGSIAARALKAKEVVADVSGVGGIQCYPEESIKGEVSGVGSLRYRGEPKHKDLKRTGVGGINQD
jgi:hypothetical protein